MAGWKRLLWRLLPEVRPRERGRFLFFLGLSGLVSLAQTLGLAGSEALFLARIGVDWLPLTFIAASAATVLGSFFYAILVGRTRNDRLFGQLLVAGALFLFASLLPASRGSVWIFPALLCFFFLAHAVLINHYWTFTWDYFDTLATKRLFPLFVIGNSLGGFVGGALAVAVSALAPTESLIAAWAVAFLAAAALLRLGRRPLRRWGPLELEETDETSVEGIHGAIRYIRSSSMAGWLVLSTVGMVLALFVSQYLYLDVFQRSFPTAQQLAFFFGAFLAVTNLLEVFVERTVTPWLIRRLGVASTNLLHPLLTLLSFAGLAADYRLGAALVARVNREALENAVAQPARTLLYNALPARFRGRLRLFQEGIVFYATMALAGALLLATEGAIEPLWLCAVGGAMSLLYLGANLVVRREYLRTLVSRLEAGRLDLSELSAELGSFEVTRLAKLWETIIADRSAFPSAAELQLPEVLVRHGITEPVLRAARHPDARIRAACLAALEQSSASDADAVLGATLGDPDADVRRAAVRALRNRAARAPLPAALTAALEARLADADPDVRAEAALALGDRGLPLLEKMAGATSTADVVAALRRLPSRLLDSALKLTLAEAPELRSEALACVARLSQPVPLSGERLAAELTHPDVRVRRAAVAALATRDDRVSLEALAGALADPSREVRSLAEGALGALGDLALPVVTTRLGASRAAEGALGALTAMATPAAKAALTSELRRRVRDCWFGVVALQYVPAEGNLGARFLRAAYGDLVRRSLRLAFRILELLEEAKVMRTVERVLRLPGARSRADALEVLSNLGDRDAAQLLVLLLESGRLDEKLAGVGQLIADLPANFEGVLQHARDSNDPWLGMAVSASEPDETEARMERLLILRQISLFGGLSLELLEAISQIMSDARYLKGEIIFREGDLGRELFLVVEGEIAIVQDYGTDQARELRRQTPATYFGEMAIVADHSRSASAVALEDSTLLVLDGEYFKELILDRPEISFEIFRVLTERINAAEKNLKDAEEKLKNAEAGRREPGAA
jgi:HEAT repeat protein